MIVKEGPVFSRFRLEHLQEMNFETLKEHDEKVWEYWKTIRKVVEYRELVEDLKNG